jgi:hypothetical protein
VIGATRVLIAARCVDGFIAGQLRVTAGALDGERPTASATVAKYAMHESYNQGPYNQGPGEFLNDIAVLTLQAPLPKGPTLTIANCRPWLKINMVAQWSLAGRTAALSSAKDGPHDRGLGARTDA